jgi:hypothetical protein
MTSRTRTFLVGSGLIVAVGLCTGLVAYYNGGLPLSASGPGPAELGYLPESATVVAYANVNEVMKSDLLKRLHTMLPNGSEREQLQNELGVDLEKDIDSVVAGFGVTQPETGATGAANVAGQTVVLIRGRFDQARIESVLKTHGHEATEYKGKAIYEEGPTGPGNGRGAVAFLEPGLIAIGSIEGVHLALDTRENGNSVRKNAEVMKFVGSLDPMSNAWVTGRIDAVTKQANIPAEAKAKLAAVQWFSVSARVDGGLSGTLRAEARDDQSGEDLRSVVRGGLAAARLMGGQNAKLDVAINSLQLSGSGKDLALAFTVPPDVLDVANGIAGLKSLAGKH